MRCTGARDVARGPERPRLRRDLAAISADGVAFSVMVGVGETYLVPFALALGLAAGQASLLATLPILAGSLLQLAPSPTPRSSTRSPCAPRSARSSARSSRASAPIPEQPE